MSKRLAEILYITIAYALVAAGALFKLLVSPGVVSQGDWGVPLTESAALHVFYSGFYIWQVYGFGSPVRTSFTLTFFIQYFLPSDFTEAG